MQLHFIRCCFQLLHWITPGQSTFFPNFTWNICSSPPVCIFFFNTHSHTEWVNFDLSRSGPSSSPLAGDAAERKNKAWWDIRAEREGDREMQVEAKLKERWRKEESRHQKKEKTKDQRQRKKRREDKGNKVNIKKTEWRKRWRRDRRMKEKEAGCHCGVQLHHVCSSAVVWRINWNLF